MKEESKYRGYVISFDGAVYSAETAEPNNSDEADFSGTDFLRMFSKDLPTLYKAIDELHTCLNTDHTDNFAVPAWAMSWIVDGRTQLDLDTLFVAPAALEVTLTVTTKKPLLES